MNGERFFIVGGAGFIGSHFTDRLLASERTRRVTLYDNFSSGRAWHYEDHADDRRLQVVRARRPRLRRACARPWRATTR